MAPLYLPSSCATMETVLWRRDGATNAHEVNPVGALWISFKCGEASDQEVVRLLEDAEVC